MHYLDHAATTPVHPDVQQTIQQALENYGNPSSVYEIGRTQKHQLLRIKQLIKQQLHASSADDIIFTASGSEGNNLVIQSFLHEYGAQGCHFITSKIEHPSVLKTMQFAEKMGCEVSYVSVDEEGIVSVDELVQCIQPTTRLISIMMVNNETGVLQPIEAIGKIAQEHGIAFHTDAVQAFGYEDVHVDQLPIDYMTVSGHKINAPKGIGFVYKRAASPLRAAIIGGGQENGLRAGTENMPYIHGLSTAIERIQLQRTANKQRLKELGAYLIEQLAQHNIIFELNGSMEHHSPHIWSLWLPNIPAHQAIIYCDLAQVAISAGSACSAGSLQPSSVLTAMFGSNNPRVTESIRLSFGEQTTKETIDAFIAAILPLAKKNNK